MTSLSRRTPAGLGRVRPIALLGAMLAVVLASQLAARLNRPPAPAPPVAQAPNGPVDPVEAGDLTGNDDVARLEANVAFWSGRFQRQPKDFVSATQWGAAEIDLARSTGDLSGYERADAALMQALQVEPGYPLALGYHAAILATLHHFADARDLALSILHDRPSDASALATLADASIELGDVTTATDAVARLAVGGPSAASLGRSSRIAFVEGNTEKAISDARAAVDAALDEGAEGERLAFYHYLLGDTLASTGDRAGARDAYAKALAADPRSRLARWGLARIAAADGDLDEAIRQLSDEIAIVPLPDALERRGDLYELRNGPGDAARAAADRKTILAIAQLSGSAAGVYDRALAMYLANHGLDPDRAVALTQSELAVRHDVYGYDAYAWALLAAGRPQEADAQMRIALAVGTNDAKLLYHAGMIKAALGDDAAARSDLSAALALDPSFDPYQVRSARTTLDALP